MKDDFHVIGVLATAVLVISTFAGLLDYLISSQPTVNAINQQCNTNYQRIDYLRVGADTMRELCRINEQKVTITSHLP